MRDVRKIAAAAAFAALLPAASSAAIDDQGMRYVSAAEGLGGSMRVFLLQRGSADGEDFDDSQLGQIDSLRLWYNGSSELGGGFTATYYWELRSEGDDADAALGTEVFHLGLETGYGTFEAGRLSMVSLRMVPAGSLDTIYGNERKTFAGDPASNGIRYETPVINGFQAGFSGIGQDLSGTETTLDKDGGLVSDSGDPPFIIHEDLLYDAWSVGVKYETPAGLWIGLGYDRFERHCLPAPGGGVIFTDHASGFNAGARYEHEAWTATYEYRTYEGYNPLHDADELFEGSDLTLSDDDRYSVHSLGVRWRFGRIIASANYSSEVQENDRIPASPDSGTADLRRETLAMDAVYQLGQRAMIGIGVHTQRAASFAVSTDGSGDPDRTRLGADRDTTRFGLYYRVDF